MKLQSLEKTLKEKKLSQDKMYNLNGGYTRTGCDRALVSDGTEWICMYVVKINETPLSKN